MSATSKSPLPTTAANDMISAVDFAPSKQTPEATLKKMNVTIAYASTSGLRAEWKAKSGAGSKHLVTGAEVPPQIALLSAIEELARLAEICGFGDEAEVRLVASRAKVMEWRAERLKAAA